MTARRDIHNSKVPILCQACEARHNGVCGALTPDQLIRLSEQTTKGVVNGGQVMQEAADTSASYSNILSGVVKLSKLMPDGRQQIVGLQFAPDFMGRPYSKESDVTIEAATDVRVCSFPKTVLESMLQESPEMEHRLYQQTLDELNEARDWLLTLGRKSAQEKLASFILLIASHIDPEGIQPDDGRQFRLPLTRSDIADFLGLTTETVSRQLTNLRKAGLIEIADRREVTVISMAALVSASGQ